PMAVFWLPVLLVNRAKAPVAVLKPPAVFKSRALAPVAVLLLAVVLLASALEPLAVLLEPTVLLASALAPIAVLFMPPSARLARALVPSAVLKSGRPPSAARTVGESVEQARARAMRTRPRFAVAGPVEFCGDELGTIRVRECIGVSFFLPVLLVGMRIRT